MRHVARWLVLLTFLTLAACGFTTTSTGVAWDADGMLLWALRLIQATGVWLTLRSAVVLDIRELAGVPVRTREDLRLSPVQRDSGLAVGDLQASEAEFKTTGPYGWVRHPIYTGWFLVVFAAAPMTMTRLVFAVVSCVYLLIAIPFEERSMRATAAGAYARYVAQVRWRLLPGVY